MITDIHHYNTMEIDLKVILKEVEEIARKEGLAESTMRSKISALKVIFQEVRNFTHDEFYGWLDSYISPRTGKKLGPHGKNRYIKALRWYLTRTRKIVNASSLLDELSLKPFPASPSPGKAISREEFEAILQYSPDALHDLAFQLIFKYAFRPHELLSIRAMDIDEVKGYERVVNDISPGAEGIRLARVQLPEKNPVTPSGRNKTGARTVIIVENASALLELAEETLKQRGAEGRIFPFKHKHFSNVFSYMKRKLSGIEGCGVEDTQVEDDGSSSDSGDNELYDEVKRITYAKYAGIRRKFAEKIGINTIMDSSVKGAEGLNGVERSGSSGNLLKSDNDKSDGAACKNGGIVVFNARLYDLRHSAITEMYARGMNDQSIRATVGWKPASRMPNTYVHIREQHVIREMLRKNPHKSEPQSDLPKNSTRYKGIIFRKD